MEEGDIIVKKEKIYYQYSEITKGIHKKSFNSTSKSFVFTDENKEEHLIIKSDARDYVGLTQNEVYISVTNIGESEEFINIQAYFPDNTETGSATAVFAADITASTNAANGYVIEIDGITLTNEYGDTIDGIGSTPTASTTGIEQFGIRAVATGTGSVESPYNDTSNHAYDIALFTDNFATGTGDNTVTNHDLEFIANIDPLTPAGEYTATLTYTMHGIF